MQNNNTEILSVGDKQSMRDLMCNVISCRLLQAAILRRSIDNRQRLTTLLFHQAYSGHPDSYHKLVLYTYIVYLLTSLLTYI